MDALIDLSSLRIPQIFRVIREEGGISDADMLRTFNMGAGLIVVCPQAAKTEVVSHLAEEGCAAYSIGEITKGAGAVTFRNRPPW